MKFKYYLRGFGTGVLFATILLIIAINIKENKPVKTMPSQNLLSEGQQATDELETEKNTTEESTTHTEKESTEDETTGNDSAVTETTEGNNNTETVEDGRVSETETTTEIQNETSRETDNGQGGTSEDEPTTDSDETPHEQPSVEPSSVEQPSTVEVTIQRGMTSRAASEMLYEEGLVDDAYEFDEYMQESGHESRLRIGIYEITKGASYEEIADIITGS